MHKAVYNEIIAQFNDGIDLSVEISTYCDAPLGTGGTLRASLCRCVSDHACVFNGDTFLDLEVDQVEALWAFRHNPIIVAHKVSDMSRYGQLSIEGNRVVGFQSKGKLIGGLSMLGVMCFPRIN